MLSLFTALLGVPLFTFSLMALARARAARKPARSFKTMRDRFPDIK